MNLEFDVNLNHDFNQAVRDFVTQRLDNLHPAKLSPEATHVINRLADLFDEIELLILPNLPIEKITDFRVLDDMLVEAINQHQRNAYELGFYDGIKFMLSMLVNQEE